MCIPKRLDLPKSGGTLLMVGGVILGVVVAIVVAHDCALLLCSMIVIVLCCYRRKKCSCTKESIDTTCRRGLGFGKMVITKWCDVDE
jgi:hypothetical protein